jgi:hypothetical protein
VRQREVLERDVDALRGVIETAADEAPIQRHLEQQPWLLASLLGGGHGRWVRPQVSLGVRWRLIELESPRVRQQIKNGEFAKEARHAIHQIEQWRSWLAANTDQARRPRDRHGLQLVDIEAGAPALILVSRRHLTDEDPIWKRQMRSGRAIEMHTYDWVLERLGRAAPAGGWLA